MRDDSTEQSMKTRYVVLVWLLGAPSVVSGQDAEEWRPRFAAGEQAREAEDFATYATEMAAAVRAMPDRHLNRPFAQYHAACGRPDRAGGRSGRLASSGVG